MYLSYDEYVEMGGKIDNAAFNIYLRRAEAEINMQTYQRLSNAETIPNEVKSCAWELIEIFHKKSKQMAGSVSNDGVSVSYETIDIEKETGNIIKRNLLHVLGPDETPLLYLGVD